MLHDFFEGDYTANPQPDTFVEANQYWDNWSLDALTTPRVNNFFDQVERLPDVKLTGWRQQVLATPVYYESESSAGYYRQMLRRDQRRCSPARTAPVSIMPPRAPTRSINCCCRGHFSAG